MGNEDENLGSGEWGSGRDATPLRLHHGTKRFLCRGSASAVYLPLVGAGVPTCFNAVKSLNRSVSKLLSFPAKQLKSFKSHSRIYARLLRAVRFPDSSLLYCIKTRFHSSRNLSQSHPTALQSCPHPKDMLSLVNYYFRAGAAGAGISHLPEVVFAPRRTILSEGIPVNLSIVFQPRHLFINRDPEPVLREFQYTRKQFPPEYRIF